MQLARDSSQRKIPIVTAIIAIVFFSVVVFGAAAVLIAHIRREADFDGDVGLHLDGVWDTDGPTVNDEYISFEFAGDSFSSVTEWTFFDASPEALAEFIAFNENDRGAIVYTDDIGYGNYRIRIYEHGEFTLEGNSILLSLNSGQSQWMPFYWDGDAIIINGDRYLRR
ncbi:MAG: YfjI family protein [Defluviitaleaceae bacterium]|nr:YfjI family protein [Defluviitaleaceae bacterium]